MFALKKFSLSLAAAGLGMVVCQAQESASEPIVPPDVAEMERLLKNALETVEEAQKSAELGDRQLSIEEADQVKAKAKEAIKTAQEQVKALEKINALLPINPLLPTPSTQPKPDEMSAAAQADEVLGPEPQRAPARKGAADEPFDLIITGDAHATVSLTETERLMVFEDNVVVTHPQFRMKCDVLRVFLGETEGEISKAIASGRMVHFSGKDEQGKPIEAVCKLAVFQNDILYLREWPEITRPGGRFLATGPSTFFLFPLKKGDEQAGMYGGPYKILGQATDFNDKPEN